MVSAEKIERPRIFEITIRKAVPGDSRVLGELMNTAGEGIPAFLWSQMAGPDEDVVAYGAKRVVRTEGAFSYTNAHVACVENVVAGMLLSYRLADPYDSGSIHEYPEVVRPVIELEAQAPGSWYINAVATLPAFRGHGIGTCLLRLAQQLAHGSGTRALSLIAAEHNTAATRLYKHLGYRTIARRPIVPFPGCPHEGDWLLMRKGL